VTSPTESSLPVQVGTDTDWADVGVGYEHTCGLKQNGSVWCWGSNSSGEHGSAGGSGATRVQVLPGTVWKKIGVGGRSACAIGADDSLWCWGAGLGGTTPARVGTGTFSHVNVEAPYLPGYSRACAVQLDGSLWCFGEGSLARIGADSDWQTIAAMTYHQCGLKKDGSLWCWGKNDHGQLGLGDRQERTSPTQVGNDTDWIQLSIGNDHTCALKTNGSLWCWGGNDYRQLLVAGLSPTGTTMPTQTTDMSGPWSQLTTGTHHSCARAADGSVWCRGYGGVGQLGNGSKPGISFLRPVY
jgi:alpha-tubulin suppressor-like RCC1 family protein